MRISRTVERTVKFILDECIPPVVRDSRLFMWLPFRFAFKDKSQYFFDFKSQMVSLSKEQIKEVYEKTSSVHIQQSKTDLGAKCLHEINENVLGPKVLDAGCGKGVLAEILSKNHKVTACDIVIDENAEKDLQAIRFIEGNIEDLPFGECEFDTVICTHALEHVQNIVDAIGELRRVTKRRLIIIVPKERPYQYTFNLHIHFFPYSFSLLNYVRPTKAIKNQYIKEMDGAWYYQEDQAF